MTPTAVQVYRLENMKPVGKQNESHCEISGLALENDWKRLLEHIQAFWKFCSWLIGWFHLLASSWYRIFLNIPLSTIISSLVYVYL